ncbi:MAG: carboxypeptidase-like regulatory domain-containing protein [Saprospiraceae bacterium]|nr:carboxypeptidase-like regulatory domain-containing protein [Saprospiraceae bacterium]
MLSVIALIILTNPIIFAQTGKIQGTVKTVKNTPIPFISVGIADEMNKGVLTQEDGSFSLSVNKGNQTLVVSGVGFETQQVAVLISEDKTTVLDIILQEANAQLQTVEITGRKETDYKNSATFIGSKSATLLKDLPQSVSYVTKELMLDQAAFRVNDVVKNMSGVNQASFYNDFTIRGHRVSGQENYSMLVNGMRSFSNFWKQ